MILVSLCYYIDQRLEATGGEWTVSITFKLWAYCRSKETPAHFIMRAIMDNKVFVINPLKFVIDPFPIPSWKVCLSIYLMCHFQSNEATGK